MLAELFRGHVGAEETLHDRARGFVTAVLIHAAQHCFEGAGKDRRLVPAAAPFFALADAQQGTEIEHGGLFREHGGIYQRRAHF